MNEETIRKLVNRFCLVKKNETCILNLDRFGNKVSPTSNNYIFKTIIVNYDSFEVNFLDKKHNIFKR